MSLSLKTILEYNFTSSSNQDILYKLCANVGSYIYSQKSNFNLEMSSLMSAFQLYSQNVISTLFYVSTLFNILTFFLTILLYSQNVKLKP